MYDSLSAEMLHQTNFKTPSRHLQPADQTSVIDKASVSIQYQHSPDNSQWVVVLFVVDTHYKHWCISTGSRDHHPLSSTLQMSLTNQNDIKTDCTISDASGSSKIMQTRFQKDCINLEIQVRMMKTVPSTKFATIVTSTCETIQSSSGWNCTLDRWESTTAANLQKPSQWW